ncbi:MAG: DUF429 domain-containing protein [Myxococcota bacterium]
MTWVAGVDGCPRGWFRVCRETETGALRFDVLETVPELLARAPRPSVVALDMPIGLPPSGARDCDVAARRAIGPRRSSVFRAPIRPALAATSRAEADRITRAIEDKGVAAQAWGIYGKVRALDEALAASPRARKIVQEVHPEVSFWAWNGQTPLAHGKKDPAGRAEREALAERWLGKGIVGRARGDARKKDVADDDILDAIATLWTAHRILDGSCERLPDPPPKDETGLPMQIVF